MSNYRRTSKPKTEHIKKGFTVFQKTVATIASILGLITASITIMNALDNNKNTKKEPTTSQTTTIVKEIQKESPKENTSPNKENNTSQEKTQQEETPKASVKEEKKEEQKASTQKIKLRSNFCLDHNQAKERLCFCIIDVLDARFLTNFVRFILIKMNPSDVMTVYLFLT